MRLTLEQKAQLSMYLSVPVGGIEDELRRYIWTRLNSAKINNNWQQLVQQAHVRACGYLLRRTIPGEPYWLFGHEESDKSPEKVAVDIGKQILKLMHHDPDIVRFDLSSNDLQPLEFLLLPERFSTDKVTVLVLKNINRAEQATMDQLRSELYRLPKQVIPILLGELPAEYTSATLDNMLTQPGMEALMERTIPMVCETASVMKLEGSAA